VTTVSLVWNKQSTYEYTLEELKLILGCTSKVAQLWLAPLNESCILAEITTREQSAAYLAQLGHESGYLKYTEELWGTKQQLKYELPNKLAKTLGNTQVGDGYRYRGRGLLQITGRANYKSCTLGLQKYFSGVPDFETNPKDLSSAKYAALSAGLFWRTHKLNTYVDRYDFVGLTKKINGGTNGLAHRQSLYVQGLLNLH
jgi:putative chitinase